jgi:hypothetical protein
VHLVNDKDLVAALLGLESDLFHQGADVVHAVVGGCIQLYDVEGSVFIEGLAAGASATGLEVGGQLLAVQDFCQDPGSGVFAHAARPAKQERMGDVICLQRFFQRLRDMRLADHILKPRGPVFSC